MTGLFSPIANVLAITCTDTENSIPAGCTPQPLGTCRTDTADNDPITDITQADCGEGLLWIPNYNLLAPLPCTPPGANGCDDNGNLIAFDPTQNSNLGVYLNMMIRLFIGICAVLAVIMIVMGGIEYMTTELISSKEAGKERIRNAIFGLLLALGAWTLLNTINPNLLNTDLKSLTNVTVDVPVVNFQISGSSALSRDGKSVNIDLYTQAYPAAAAAFTQTGVDPALILAVFNQETSSGSNTGRCSPSNANMLPAEQTALASIVGSTNVATTPVSCSLSQGHGGAIGLTQFMPTTWNDVLKTQDAKTVFAGRSPDPWNTNDALMMTALYLKAKGAATDPTKAAQAYFGNPSASSGIDYGAQVTAKMNSLKTQIAQAKKDGKI